jgi:hypothetical protein
MLLSNMADQKAQICLGVSSLIVTFALTRLTGSFSWAMSALVVTMFASMIPAILAITPNLGTVTAREFDKIPLPESNNPLFFASFAQLDPNRNLEEMNYIIKDSDELYKALFLNIYNNGKVMAEKKYRLIGYSYRIFLVSMVIGIVVAVIEALAVA